MLRLFLPLAVGIGAAHYTEWTVPHLPFILVAGSVVLVYLANKRGIRAAFWRYGMVLSAVLFGLGYWLVQFHDVRRDEAFVGRFALENQRTQLVGTVDDLPVLKNGRQVFTLRLEGVQDSSEVFTAATGRVLVRAQTEEELQYGDRLLLRGYLNQVSPPGNPHAFDYRQFLAQRGIHHQIYPKEVDLKPVERSAGGYWILRKATTLRREMVETLRKHLPDAQTFSVGSALVLGYKDEMDPEIRDAYAATGAMHVLAVSGLHVGIIALLLNFAFVRWLEPYDVRWKRWKLPFVLSGIWAFVLLTGASPSVLRAGTMFSFIAIGTSIDRRPRIYNTLALSAFFLLIFDPNLLFSVGFQLSYAAVLGIVYLQPKLAAIWTPRNGMVRFFWNLLLVSVAAQLGTLPLSLHYFHQFPTYFMLSGLVVIPAATVILPLGLITLVSGYVSTAVADFFGMLLYWVIWFVNECILALQNLPFSLVSGFWVPALVALTVYMVYFGFVRTWYSRRLRGALVGLGLFTAIGLFYSFRTLAQGEREQLLIYQTRDGLLIDCFSGFDRYTLRSDSIIARSEQFAAADHRTAFGPHRTVALNLDTVQNFPRLAVHENTFRFRDRTVVVLQETPPRSIPRRTDFLIVTETTTPRVNDLLHYNPELVVLGADLPWRDHERWKRALAEAKIPFHSLRDAGAFQLDL